jgi:gliding motility-associated-like protein
MPVKGFKYYCLLIFVMVSGVKSFSQAGALNHAVLYENFGKGNSDPSTIGPPLPPGRTQFTYSTNWCPPQGSYTIARRVNINGCPKDWIPLGSDRTSDYDTAMDYGFMMMVNNVNSVSTVYIDTIETDFCENTIYNFSAAVINLSKKSSCTPGFPQFNFLVEPLVGRVVYMSYLTGDIAYADPTRLKFMVYGKDFQLPPGTKKVVVRIIAFPNASNNNGCGIDFAIDDIIIQAKGPAVNINFEGLPQQYGVSSTCFQQNKRIKMEGAADPYYNNPVYQWEQSIDNGNTWSDIPGATNLSYEQIFSVPDTFFFRLRSSEAQNISSRSCGVISNTLKVEVNGIPTNFRATNNSPLCAGQDLKFNADGGASYVWSGPNGFYDNIPFPHIYHSSLADSGMYYVQVITTGGCKATDSTYVTMLGTDVIVGPDTSICKGRSVQLHASGGIKYIWSPANNLSNAAIANPKATPDITTTYNVEVTDQSGCINTGSVIVSLLNSNAVKAAFSTTGFLCRVYDSASFKDISTGNIIKWSWDFGNGQTSLSQSPSTQTYLISNNTKSYTARLAVADTVGCADTIYHVIKVADNCYIAVPSAFTPNNDGLNDYLYPLNAYKATNLWFRVYNRLGQKVFETKDWTKQWNGTTNGIQQDTGVYVWMLDYIDASGKKVSLKGTTTLIR